MEKSSFFAYLLENLLTPIMNNKLRLLIRQTLFENHSKTLLSEAHQTVKTMSSKLSPDVVARVEARFNEINANINAAAKYTWQPKSVRGKSAEGAANAKESNDEFNLLVEMIHERMPIEQQKNVFMIMYSQNNPYLEKASTYYIIKNMGNANPALAGEAFRDAWERFFLGTSQKRDTTKEYKKFEQYAADYDKNIVDKGEDANSTINFAGKIVTSIQSLTKEEYEDNMKSQMQSLDAPSRITGKSTDVDSGEDFGSDALHAGDAGDTLSDFGGSFEDNDETSVDLDTDITTDDYEETGAEGSEGDTLGGELSDELSDYNDQGVLAFKQAKKMSKILLTSLLEAIHDLKNAKNSNDTILTPAEVAKLKLTDNHLAALNALEHVITTGDFILTGHQLDALKKSSVIVNVINKYLHLNGFKNSRGKAVSFLEMNPKSIAKAVLFAKTKDPKLVPDEGLSSNFVGDKEAKEKTQDIFGSGTDIKDIGKKVISIKKNLKNIVNANPSEENLEGVQALDGIFKGMDLRQVSQKLGKSAADVNKAVLSLNQGADAQEVVDLVRALKTGKLTKGYEVPYDPEAEQALAEAVEKANTILMERFTKKHLDKIMERVYSRLSKNL